MTLLIGNSMFVPLLPRLFFGVDIWLTENCQRHAGILITPIGQLPAYVQPSAPVSVAARSNTDLDGLVKCTDELGKVKREMKKVMHFFDAVAVLSHTIISVHIKLLKYEGEYLIARRMITSKAERAVSFLIP